MMMMAMISPPHPLPSGIQRVVMTLLPKKSLPKVVTLLCRPIVVCLLRPRTTLLCSGATVSYELGKAVMTSFLGQKISNY